MAADSDLKTEALARGGIAEYYRDHVSAWFKRYGWLKSPEGVVTKYPNLRERVVQKRMFAEVERCTAAGKPCMMMVLKPRKDGASTGAQAINYHWMRRWHGRAGGLMGDIAGTSDTVFELFRGFARNDDMDWKDGFGRLNPEDDLTDDIVLGNKSTYKKVTAGSSNAGRSGTVQIANLTEVAYYPDGGDRDPALGFLGSWHADGPSSLGIMDSTAAGPFGTFYEYWVAQNGWAKIFVAWFEEAEHAIAFDNPDERAKFEREMDKDERDEQMKYRVTLEQLKWRRKMIQDKCGGSADKFRQEYPSDPMEAFLRKSRTRFKMETLTEMERAAAVHPPSIVTLMQQQDGTVSPYPDPQGDVFIWEQPKIGCKYLLSLDSCTGRDQQQTSRGQKPDWHSIGIWRDSYTDRANMTEYPPMLAALHYSQLEVDIMAQIAAAMSTFYGLCIAVVEVNGCGLYPVKKLQELEIPVWERPRANAQTNTVDVSGGWMTTEIVRKTIVDNLGSLISKWKPGDPSFECFSIHVINQLKKFIKNDSGRDEAMPGEHDDDVMMTAIGLYNMPSATEMKEPTRPRVDLRKMMASQGWRMGPNTPGKRN